MATKSYSGSMAGATGLNTNPICSLSGSGSVSGIVNSIVASLNFSTNAYANTYPVTASLFFSGGSVSSSQNIKMDGANYTNATYAFWFPTLTAEQADSIYQVQVSCSSNSSKIFLKGAQSATVDYTVPSAVGAPSSVHLGSAATTTANNTLYWSGAYSGNANNITGYIIQYADSSDGNYFGSWTDYTTVSSNSTSGSCSASMPSTGYYRKFRVMTLGSAGSSYYSGYTESASTYRAYMPSAPANLLPEAGVYLTLSTISWDAVTCTDPVSGYQYQISRNGGSTWESEINITSRSVNFASIFSAAATSVRFRFHVRAYTNKGVYSAYATSGVFYRISKPTAPTVFTATPANYESGKITLAWSGVTDEDTNIVGYQLEFATSANNASWSDWAELGNVISSAFSGSTTDEPDMTRGNYRKYRIRAYDTNELYSDWKESASVYRPLSATIPGSLSPVGGYYETAPMLSWSASTAPDGNLAGYQVQISTDGGQRWGPSAITQELSSPCTGFDAAARGTMFAFRVCAFTTTGATSDWAVSQTFGKNTLPETPEIVEPFGSPTVYGTGAWIVLSCAAKSNMIPQTLEHKLDSGAWETVQPSTVGAFIVAYRATASGTHYFKLTDAAGASDESAFVVLTISTRAFTDTITGGTTSVKAVHLNELREITDAYRLAYGLAAYIWDQSIEAGTTSLRQYNAHIAELRDAVNQTINQLNMLSSRVIVPVPLWSALPLNVLRADAINELRTNIRKL